MESNKLYLDDLEAGDIFQYVDRPTLYYMKNAVGDTALPSFKSGELCRCIRLNDAIPCKARDEPVEGRKVNAELHIN